MRQRDQPKNRAGGYEICLHQNCRSVLDHNSQLEHLSNDNIGYPKLFMAGAESAAAVGGSDLLDDMSITDTTSES
jgi:hypothetical protein